MAYDGKLLAKARNQLDNIRAANQAEQQRRRGLVYARMPELERGVGSRVLKDLAEKYNGSLKQ